MTKKKMFFAGNNIEPDVKLGGMASVITGKSDLLGWFVFATNNVSEITRFWIEGNDVFFKVKNPFSTSVKFTDNPMITSFMDYKGKFNGGQIFEYFKNTANLAEVFLPIARFSHSTYSGSNISLIHQPKQEILGGRTFENTSNLTEIKQPLAVSSAYYECRNSKASLFDFPMLESINSNSGENWSGCTNATLINAPKLKVIGSLPESNIGNFNSIKLGCEIRVHIDLFTANSGAPQEDLVYAKNVRSATVKFYDNSGNYVSTL